MKHSFNHEKEVCYDELMCEIKIVSVQNKTRKLKLLNF